MGDVASLEGEGRLPDQKSVKRTVKAKVSPRNPIKPGPSSPGGYRRRVVVKFHDFVEIPYEDGAEVFVAKYGIGPWEDLFRVFPGVSLKRMFVTPGPERIRELVAKAREIDQTYRPPNLLTYFAVDCPPSVDAAALARAFSAWRNVEAAYVEAGPTRPPVVNAADDPRWPSQGYLDAAPAGIDAEFAWGAGGGDGAGVLFVDLEQGWTLNHEDLVAAGITLISGVNQAYTGHGTSVLGEVLAVDNALGDVGIAPAASGRVVSQWRTASTYNTAEAILSAVDVMDFGDALLLEAQTTVTGVAGFLPVEVEQAVFDAIRLGTALGVVVVEAAGNGSNDLDTFADAGGNFILNRGSAAFRDSGAIMVGAASSVAPHTRLGFSNFGSRIDCYAWGQNIDTTGDGWTGNLTNSYTGSFGGTSGASPIVTGAAILVQAMLESSRGYRFSPLQLRAILSNPATGTPSSNPAVDRIGVMPNLNSIIGTVLNVMPDVYLRDFVGDTGDPNTGPISASPDIILRPAQVPNPQASFGEGSGTENDATLGYEVEAGQDNYIYVRVRNRGGAAAANVVATVYWSPVASLVTPNLWTLVGSVPIPNVPIANLLTVSGPITWPSAALPGPGHYCLVGLIGNAADPAPNLAAFGNWANFQRFIRENNNVTWRNFNVVNNVPPAGANPPNFVPLSFMAAGAHDEARKMRLEVVAHLPERARILLEAPVFLLDAMQERTPFRRVIGRKGLAHLPLNPHGRHVIGEALFPAKLRANCRLLVDIPREASREEYEVYVRQVHEGEEVGRVTWRLVSPERLKQRLERHQLE